MLRVRLVLSSALMLLLSSNALAAQHSATNEADSIKWQPWSNTLFETAKKQHKLIVLDLEAVWCHWCHVMEARTYSNPAVQRIINSDYIAVRVDQDSRPDLSNKYEDYGWPATIIFNADGTELVKRSGFISPEDMVPLLESTTKNPVPEEKSSTSHIAYSSATSLPEELKQELVGKHVNGYDSKYGSWSTFQKFLDADSVEYAMTQAKSGDKDAADRAKKTLTMQLNLLDPVWGGIYQYSTHGDWEHPHFEKIMAVQSDNLRMYSLGYALFREPKYLSAAEATYNYLSRFLKSPDGAFYTSQDADIVKGQHSDWYFKLNDIQRQKHGTPNVDKHIYARENGWAINAIVALYAATGSKRYLDCAVKTADWIVANRSLGNGGFRHDDKDDGGPYLGDTLYMGRAFLALYTATGDRQWLKRAEDSADFIIKHFTQKQKDKMAPGLLTAEAPADQVSKPVPLLDENIAAARFFNLLSRYDGNKDYKQVAGSIMGYLATPDIARKRKILVAGILLADKELNNDPVHITVVGPKRDPEALTLFQAALAYPAAYKEVEWLDRSEGPLPSGNTELPTLEKSAAFACAAGRCSLPIYKPEKIQATLDRF